MNRTQCVICSGKLLHLYTLENIPISFSPPVLSSKYTDDKITDQKYGYCEDCGCVQLINLIDPIELYKNAHNITFNTPTWKEHHQLFANYVLDKIKEENTITEIGGMSGVLSNHILKERSDIKYTCLDICDTITDISNITFIQGNCEDYNFKDTNTIIMSHVFEHLYNPAKFVENISNCNVKQVIVSIPNMEELLLNKNLNTLHFEHTYYIDKSYITWLFKKNGYNCNNIYMFKNHSFFFYFIKNNDKCNTDISNNTLLVEQFNKLFEVRQSITKINIKENSFIAPSGHFGQLIHTLCNPASLIGFLDNDISKQYHRVYGTPYMVYPFSKLLDYENANVYIYAGPYNNEIIKQLSNYKVNIHII